MVGFVYHHWCNRSHIDDKRVEIFQFFPNRSEVRVEPLARHLFIFISISISVSLQQSFIFRTFIHFDTLLSTDYVCLRRDISLSLSSSLSSLSIVWLDCENGIDKSVSNFRNLLLRFRR